MREGSYCGGGLVAIKPRALDALERFLGRLGDARKNPLQLASIFGWEALARYAAGRLSIADAERRAHDLLGVPARAVVSQPGGDRRQRRPLDGRRFGRAAGFGRAHQRLNSSLGMSN